MWWGILLCFIIVLVFHKRYVVSSLENQMLTGFWEADDAFSESSGIDKMVFWFGDKKDSNGYLVLVVNGEDVHNDRIKMTYSPGISGGTITLGEAVHNIPRTLKAEIDIPNGQLLLSDKGTLYARLYRKNHESLLGILDAQPDSETLAD